MVVRGPEIMGEQERNSSVAHSGDEEVGVDGRQEERKRSVPVVNDAGEVRM